MKKICFLILFFYKRSCVVSQTSKVWVADNGNGTFKNPAINTDYSDSDAIRVGDDFLE